MKKLSKSLADHINSDVTTLATCVKIKLNSGKIITLTDSDQNLNIDGLIYNSNSGFSSSSIIISNDLSVDNFDIDMIINSNDISEQEILAGLYDHAQIEIFMVNYESPKSGIIDITQGYFGEIKINGGKFTVEVRGLTYKFDKLIGELYSPNCRAKFGDQRCKIDRNRYSKSGVVEEITSCYSFIDSSRVEKSDYFDFGIVEFDKFKYEIKDFKDKRLEFYLPLDKSIKAGDKYTVTPGCDKTANMCKNKYSNIINFRGEPHVPGNKILY